MATRIYALAKELQIDNKKLVDICTRAGITGKGSALASLTDEEEVLVRSLVAKGGKPDSARAKVGPGAAPRSIRREDYIAPAGGLPGSKVPVLAPKHDKPPLLRKKGELPSPAHIEPAAPAAVIEAPPPASGYPVTAPPASPLVAPATEPPAVAAKARRPRRQCPRQSAGGRTLKASRASGPGPPLGAAAAHAGHAATAGQAVGQAGSGRQDQRKETGRQEARRKGRSRHAFGPAADDEVALALQAQGADAAKAGDPLAARRDPRSKAGTRPLSEQLRKHEEKKKRDDLAKKGAARPGAEAAPGVLPPTGLPSGKERPGAARLAARREPKRTIVAG